MIMARNEDGTYSQVGFVKDNNGVDTEYIYDKDGDKVFEKGFTREMSSTVPLQINSIGKDLKEWSITGNTVQNGTPTPENPVEVFGCGDRTANLFDYKIYFESTFTEYNEFFEFAEIQLKPFTTYTFTTSLVEYIGTNAIVETPFIITTSTEEPRTLTGGISSTRIRTKTTESDGIIKIYKRIKGSYDPNFPKKEDFDSGMHWLMINEGDTALPYEPYGYKIPIVTSADGAEPITTPIYLSEPLQAGEVLRSDGSREVKWSVKVFDGSENWIYGDENSYGIVYFYLKLNSHKYDNAEFTDIKCTHLPESKLYFSNSKSECCALWTGPTGLVVYLRLKKTNMATVDDLKLWLSAQYAAGTPVTILYSLVEPTTETIAVPQIPTFDGTTVIDIDTKVKPSNFYGKYKSRI